VILAASDEAALAASRPPKLIVAQPRTVLVTEI
jgi:hypothetical protein